VHDAFGSIATARYRVVQGVHRKVGLHPVADRVADDPAGGHVLDRAEVELPLIGPVLRKIGQPQFVDVIDGEVPLHEIIVDRWPGTLPVLAALLAEGGPPLVVSADLPRGPLAHHLAGLRGLVDQEPVPVLGVIAMGVHQGVGAVGLDQLGWVTCCFRQR